MQNFVSPSAKLDLLACDKALSHTATEIQHQILRDKRNGQVENTLNSDYLLCSILNLQRSQKFSLNLTQALFLLSKIGHIR